ERLSRLLDENRGQCRVVTIHHPPVKITPSHKRLIGIERFQKVIADHGAELVLHGHTHLADHNSIPGPNGGVPVLGVPAAGNNLGNLRPAGRYNLFEIGHGKKGWSINWCAFGADPTSGQIVKLVDQALY
ncbi:MAG: metallophosphoesterase, partial [Pseudomonadota bacterium]